MDYSYRFNSGLFLSRSWGEESVYYHCLSGDTVLLSFVAVRFLDRIADKKLTLSDLQQDFEAIDCSALAEFSGDFEKFIGELVSAGLLEKLKE